MADDAQHTVAAAAAAAAADLHTADGASIGTGSDITLAF